MMKLLRFLLPASLCVAAASFVHAAEKFTIAMIPKGTTHEFWKSVHAGGNKAVEELAAKGVTVDLIWKGPLKEDDRDQQIQVVENFMARRVNGIVLAPLDEQALVRPVTNAMRAKVPVVIFDSGLKGENYVSFVATDNYKGGQLGGEHLAKLLGGKGRVILLRYQVGSNSTDQREKGFMDAIAKYPDIKVISQDQYSGATRETAYQAAQNLLNRFGKEVDGIFTPCEPVCTAVTKAVRDIGRAGGQVKIVGFDAGTQTVKDLEAGDVQAIVVQNPVLMGYQAVVTMVEHLQGKKVEKRIDTGVAVVTKENMTEPKMAELLNPPLDRYLKE
jgi:ribose transport system substrate-binding protein